MSSMRWKEDSGQALIELALCLSLLCVLVFGIVDFGRLLYAVEVIKNLASEGSSMALRQTSPAQTAANVVAYAGSALDLSTKGCVIVTVVSKNDDGTLAITDQSSVCNVTATSKIGCLKGQNGCGSSNPTLPTDAKNALQAEVSGSSLYVTEVFYTYNTISPVSAFLRGAVFPSQLYSVDYY